MIIDNIKNAHLYYDLGNKYKKALIFLENFDKNTFTPERIDYEIDGIKVFAFAKEYQQKPVAEGKWETHNNYADIHYVAEGEQLIGYAYKGNIKNSEGYDSEKDLEFVYTEGEFIKLKAGSFAIMLPSDVHMPDIAPTTGAVVKKVVVKIMVD